MVATKFNNKRLTLTQYIKHWISLIMATCFHHYLVHAIHWQSDILTSLLVTLENLNFIPTAFERVLEVAFIQWVSYHTFYGNMLNTNVWFTNSLSNKQGFYVYMLKTWKIYVVTRKTCNETIIIYHQWLWNRINNLKPSIIYLKQKQFEAQKMNFIAKEHDM